MFHNEQTSPNTPITWKDDFSDDWTAECFGLMLRAERMNADDWWWAVYDMQNAGRTVGSSNEYDNIGYMLISGGQWNQTITSVTWNILAGCRNKPIFAYPPKGGRYRIRTYYVSDVPDLQSGATPPS